MGRNPERRERRISDEVYLISVRGDRSLHRYLHVVDDEAFFVLGWLLVLLCRLHWQPFGKLVTADDGCTIGCPSFFSWIGFAVAFHSDGQVDCLPNRNGWIAAGALEEPRKGGADLDFTSVR